jgi:phosphate uptake regulator
MHNDAILAVKTRDTQLANEVMLTDNEVDRFNLYVTRLLRGAIQNPRVSKEIGLINGKDCLGYTVVTRLIERTADHAAAIAENSLNLKNFGEDIIEAIEKLSNLAIGMVDSSMEALFRQDFNKAEKIIEQKKDILTLEKQAVFYSQVDVEDFAYLRLIIESLRRTAEYASDIAEIVLNLNADSIGV